MTAPRWMQRLFALGLLAGLVAVVFLVGVQPWIEGYRTKGEMIEEARRLHAYFERVAASRPALEDLLAQARLQQASGGTHLTGETDALVGAGLQELVSGIVENSGGSLRSVQVLPLESDGDFRRVSVRVQFEASTDTLFRAIYAIEAHEPFIFVEDFDIRDTRRRRRNVSIDEAEPSMIVRLDLFGLVEPDA